MKTIRRSLHPETRVMDEAQGLVEYVASDETIDSFNELIRASGWKFNHFQKNAPFVDSHRYGSVEDLLGRVVEFEVKKRKLVEVVKWAIDVPDNRLAQLGFAMTKAGYARAVSVGFWPTKMVSKWDNDPSSYSKEVDKLELEDNAKAPARIFLEQEQIELSAVVIGANSNALARAYKACVINDEDLEFLSDRRESAEHGAVPIVPAAEQSHLKQAARRAFLLNVREIITKL